MSRGNIIARGRGYRITVRLGYDEDKKKYIRYREQFNGTSKQAEKRLTAILAEYDKGEFIVPGKCTLKEYLTHWLNSYCKINLDWSTYNTYEIMTRVHINPVLGKMDISKVKRPHIQKLLADKLEAGKSKRTVQYIHTTLSKSLKMAVAEGYISKSPVFSEDAPKPEHHEIKVMTESQIVQFLEDIGKSEYYALFYTALFCGMRRSELLGLRWSDVDLLNMTLSINRSLKVKKGGEIYYRQPKTSKSRRLIALTPTNAIILRDYYHFQDKLKKELYPELIDKSDPDKFVINDSDPVFCRLESCRPFLPNTVTHAWIKLVRKHNLQGVRFHDCRHTMATVMLNKNIHPAIVQQRLGHARISTTLDIYSHVVPGLQEAAAKALDEAIFPQPQPVNQPQPQQ